MLGEAEPWRLILRRILGPAGEKPPPLSLFPLQRRNSMRQKLRKASMWRHGHVFGENRHEEVTPFTDG